MTSPAARALEPYLPSFDVRHAHAIVVDAPAARTFDILRATDLTRDPITRALFMLRGLPRGLTVAELTRLGFVVLEEAPGRAIVLGVIGKPWRPTGAVASVTAEAFRSFAEPGYAKAAWSLAVEPAGPASCVITTETRAATTDARAAAAFRRYWRVVGPFSAVTRRRLLAVVKRDAERAGAVA